MTGNTSKEGLRLQFMQPLRNLLLMYLRIIIEKRLQFLRLPPQSQVDHVRQFRLDDDHIILMYLSSDLRLEYHQHEDGIFEVGEIIAFDYFEFLIGDDEVDDGLDGFVLHYALDLLHELC